MYGWYMWWSMCGTPRNIFYYNKNRKCVLWLGRDEQVEAEIWVLKFGALRSLQPTITLQRI